MVDIITDENFESFVNQKDQLVLVDFYADWCVPCKMLKPILEQISKDEIIPIGKLNIEKSPKVSEKIGIKGVPTMILYKNNLPLDMKFGFNNKAQIIEWITSYNGNKN
ncbi:MAG: thioredoxin [Rickettsia sp.]|nr:thioredoxin [Rickettsia sp.]